MKKNTIITITLILVAVIATAIITSALNATDDTELYSKTTVVAEVNTADNIVVCEDCEGELWVFEGCEGWQEGDFASLLMDTCNTEDIYDDEIVEVNYCGNVQGLV